jgi:hypothetical protein
MSNIIDFLEQLRKQQREFSKLVDSPALKAVRQQQQVIANMVMTTPLLQGINAQQKFIQSISNLSNRYGSIQSEFNKLTPLFESMNKLKIDLPNSNFDNQNLIFAEQTTINVATLFNDVTFDSLSVLEEVFNEYDNQIENSELNSSSTIKKTELVANMTKEELRSEISSAIEAAQAKLNKDMTKQERLRSFFRNILDSYKQDAAKYIIGHIIGLLFQLMFAIAVGNHDIDVAKEVSKKINENDKVTAVKKTFNKNSDIEKPIGEMAFLRIETPLRTLPQKQSHIVSNGQINKNTVVIPVHKKGNWVLVEVETKEEFFTGWVEESKLIKFKLNK